MAGAQIKITVDNAEVLAGLRAIQTRLGDLSPVMRLVAGVLADVTEEAFATERDPATLTPWQRLEASTIDARTRKGYWPGKILQQTGLLAASISQDHGSDFASVGSNREYAAIQQLGGKAGRGGSAVLPARPYLGLSQDGADEILDLIGNYLVGV